MSYDLCVCISFKLLLWQHGRPHVHVHVMNEPSLSHCVTGTFWGAWPNPWPSPWLVLTIKGQDHSMIPKTGTASTPHSSGDRLIAEMYFPGWEEWAPPSLVQAVFLYKQKGTRNQGKKHKEDTENVTFENFQHLYENEPTFSNTAKLFFCCFFKKKEERRAHSQRTIAVYNDQKTRFTGWV